MEQIDGAVYVGNVYCPRVKRLKGVTPKSSIYRWLIMINDDS